MTAASTKAIAEILDVDFAHMSDIKQVRWMSSKSRAVSALEQNLKAVAGHLEHNSVSGTRADVRLKSHNFFSSFWYRSENIVMNLPGFCFNAFSFMTASSTKSDISINNRSSS
jgi:hypothetical protein